jgi:TolB-like protein/DNA-binding winged helix-turn-helix (wHTH) protein/Flp pilus assembly protein TadD
MRASIIRLDQFELDLSSYELRKSGRVIRLERIPMDLLILLAEKRGQLVTREEIIQRLWGDDVFVDTRQGVNTAIRKIRLAVRDDPDQPRILQTVVGKGYRLIAAPAEDEATERELLPTQPARQLPPPRNRTWTAKQRVLSALFVLILGVATALTFQVLRKHRPASREGPEAIQSLAVMPLENLSGDPAQQYISDGLTDELINDLAQIHSLRVISRTSAMRYKGAEKSLPEVAHELNVQAVVEGSVKLSGKFIRINVKLIHAPTDRQLWASSYEREAEGMARLEGEVALAIAHEVSGRITIAEEARLANNRPTDPRAYDAYLHGRYLWNEREGAVVPEAVGYFEQALREDPHFALAYSGLADCYTTGWWENGDLARGEKYARKALALQPDLAEAHASLGINQNYQHRFEDAEKELRRAIELNPNYVMAHHWYAGHLLGIGRPADALAENDRALQLDPFSFPVNTLRGIILICLHQFDRAIEQFEKLSAINPESSLPHEQLARIYWDEGRIPEALSEERKISTLDHSPHGAALLKDQEEITAAYKLSGTRAAQLKSAQLKEKDYKRAYDALDIALQYGAMGDRKKVMEWISRAVQDNDGNALFWQLKSAPELEQVRSDSHFKDVLRQAGLPL